MEYTCKNKVRSQYNILQLKRGRCVQKMIPINNTGKAVSGQMVTTLITKLIVYDYKFINLDYKFINF